MTQSQCSGVLHRPRSEARLTLKAIQIRAIQLKRGVNWPLRIHNVKRIFPQRQLLSFHLPLRKRRLVTYNFHSTCQSFSCRTSTPSLTNSPCQPSAMRTPFEAKKKKNLPSSITMHVRNKRLARCYACPFKAGVEGTTPSSVLTGV